MGCRDAETEAPMKQPKKQKNGTLYRKNKGIKRIKKIKIKERLVYRFMSKIPLFELQIQEYKFNVNLIIPTFKNRRVSVEELRPCLIPLLEIKGYKPSLKQSFMRFFL